jgi:hypothetical protein
LLTALTAALAEIALLAEAGAVVALRKRFGVAAVAIGRLAALALVAAHALLPGDSALLLLVLLPELALLALLTRRGLLTLLSELTLLALLAELVLVALTGGPILVAFVCHGRILLAWPHHALLTQHGGSQ